MDKTKKEDQLEPSPFEGVQKNAVLHEANVFNESMINPDQCIGVLTRIMFLLIQGEIFSSDEATKVFFSVTKLFRSQDAMLRRMVYLLIKELGRNQENVFIVINCLSKDMTSNLDLFQANAIRVLSKVIDAPMLGQMERFIKQAIVDRNPMVSSSALLSGQNLFRLSPDVVKRWVNEVQDALNSSANSMVQFHALGLLYQIKKTDRLALSKVVSVLSKKPPRSPLAHCLLIRYALQIIGTGGSGPEEKALIDFLSASLHKSSSMVSYEAAKALCFLPGVTPAQVAPAVSILQEFLNSAVPAQRFGAVRTLNAIVSKYPMYVTPCRVDLELLMTDPNRNIATLAITTLLKTGIEGSIDTLMKTISSFMSEISDELRIVLIDAIQQLSLKFPYKYDVFLDFLSSILREEGGFVYKRTIVDAILTIMKENADAKESGLEYLCDFIEDCEYPLLSVQILDFLGEEGPKTKSPARFIRYIFNRVILEQPRVRSAAVSSLAKFASTCPGLTDSILSLMQRCLIDNDDEVRDRAVYYTELFINDKASVASALHREINTPYASLEYSLQQYLAGDASSPFSLKDVIAAPVEAAAAPTKEAKAEIKEEVISIVDTSSLDIINSIPEFESLGEIYKSCKVIELTESEAEYRVSCIKHVFQEHVLFQYNVTNNMQQVLTNILVETEADNPEWMEEMAVPIDALSPTQTGTCFVVIRRPEGAFASGLIHNTLKFHARDLDADESDALEDTYHLEEIEVLPTDFVKPGDDQEVAAFRQEWEALGNEVVKRFSLNIKDLNEAVSGTISLLSMKAIAGSDQLAEAARSHTANLIGVFITGDIILARAGFAIQDPKTPGVTLKVAARSVSPELSQIVPNAIR